MLSGGCLSACQGHSCVDIHKERRVWSHKRADGCVDIVAIVLTREQFVTVVPAPVKESLFKTVMREEGMEGREGEVLHIGDHYISDYLSPRKIGMKSFLYNR